MGTDYWPTQEGIIVPGLDIGFYYAADTVTEGKPVKNATGVAGIVKCQNGAAIGDAFGIALKSADAGQYVPVAVSGVIKVVVDGLTTSAMSGTAITTGDLLMNSELYVFRYKISGTTTTSAKLKVFNGASFILGMAMQPSTASSDEILMLLGKTG